MLAVNISTNAIMRQIVTVKNIYFLFVKFGVKKVNVHIFGGSGVFMSQSFPIF